MVRLLGTICLYLAAVHAAAALTVTTAVDRDTVRPGESIVVTYTVDGQVPDPDFSPLEKEFTIVERSRSRNVTVAGGETGIELAWKLVLEPAAGGALTLPPVRFGDQLSEARTVNVAQATPAKQANDDLRIEYSLDDPTPYVNQQLVLTVKVRAAGSIDELAVSTPQVVHGQARIDRLGGSRQYETVRGSRRYEVREQRYTVVPGAAGMLRLSPVRIEGRVNGAEISRRSEPLVVEVLKAVASGAGKDEAVAPEDLFLEVEVDKRAAYVQEQVQYMVRVYRAVAIENASLSKPTVRGGEAIVERLGDDRRYQAQRDGHRYAVTERRFAVFPQASGTLVIEPVRLSASVALPSAGGGSGSFWRQPLTRSMRVESEPRTLTVKAPPPGAPSPWLPAQRITLEEDWPERDTIELGTPITRRITLTAEALMASQLPDLDVPLPDGVKSYPERPRRATTGGGRAPGFTGELEQTLAIIPARAGVLTLPALELEWWNTAMDRRETVSLPARTIEVTGSPSLPPAADTPARTTEAAPSPASRPGWWVAAGLALVWLATLALWWRDRRRLSAGPPAGTDVGASRRRAERRLRPACRAGDAAAARDALLDWARACWPDAPPRSLGALAAMTGGALASEIAALQRALYAPDADAWRGNELYDAVTAFRPGPAARQRASAPALRPLYEH